ncbi:MAG: SDR family NAD(P)-dependent oxidoreductase [Myxococcaceae bacterium]|nr:SDR family NAD(P)-dependent oxidoreductase [Myxococcaceae bacterium]
MEPALLVTGLLVWTFAALALTGRLRTALGQRARLDVAGKTVVVTGCDSGFGRGVVEELARRRCRVIACCYTEEGSRAALAAGAALAPRIDLSTEAGVEAAADTLVAACGAELWALVHNAGIVLPGFIDYQPPAFYRSTMEVNFFGPTRLTQRLLPALKQARGRVVLVSSVDGLVSLPGNAPYDASKFALEAFADALRAEVSFWGVEVSVVNPSTMRTPLALTFFEGHRKAWGEMARLEPDGAWQRDWPREWLDEYVTWNTKSLERIAQAPTRAVLDIVHAVTARRPRLRYLSGTLARTLFYALWVGPESWAARVKTAMIHPAPRTRLSTRGGRGWLVVVLGALVLAGVALVVTSKQGAASDAGPHVTGMLHVNVNCSDFTRSKAFYEALGFRALMDVAPDGEGGVARAVGMERYRVRGALLVHADGSTIDLLEWEQPRDARPPPDALNHLGLARIALVTRDLDADVARLRARGVEFLSAQPGEVRDPVGGTTRFICFKDPDGTVLELVQLGTTMSLLRSASSAAAEGARDGR